MNISYSKTLYAKDARGDIREWTIIADIENCELIYEYGLVNGQKIQKTEQVFENLSRRNIFDQIALQFDSRVNRMLDRGYVPNIEQAAKARTNMLGLPMPMLAQKFSNVRNIQYEEAFIQRKYDGNRCLIANVGGRITAYSRNGKPITGINHITDQLDLSPGTILDGELYKHGVALQTLASWIKRKQDETKQLEYCIYDLISDAPFYKRFEEIQSIIPPSTKLHIANTYRCPNFDKAQKYFDTFREEGYEGAILRWGNSGYEDGKRSKSLVKLKGWRDAEFEVLDISPSKDDWGVLHMQMPGGQRFRATAPGGIDEKIDVLQNKEKYVGRTVTVEYAYLTKEGIPFHPIAKAWRPVE